MRPVRKWLKLFAKKDGISNHRTLMNTKTTMVGVLYHDVKLNCDL